MSDLNSFAASLISSAGVKSFTGDEITISAGGYTTEPITAEAIDSGPVVDEASGQFIEWKGRTFKIDAADLVLNGVEVLPVPGMRITHGSQVFEVQPPTPTQQCYESPLGGLRLLIYAKRIG